MSSTARSNRINIDLQAYKQAWRDYCKARGVTPSDAFRQVVAKLTAAGAAGEPGEQVPKTGAKRSARKFG